MQPRWCVGETDGGCVGVLNSIANILQNDMSVNNNSPQNKVHIWRMSTPNHYNWSERLKCMQNAKDQVATNVYEFEIFQKSNYSIPIIDYNNILSSLQDSYFKQKNEKMKDLQLNSLHIVIHTNIISSSRLRR